jgi:hypothetical protein
MSWATITGPVSFNSGIGTPQAFTAPTTNFGYDSGSPGGTFTAWGGATGVLIPNPNGQIILFYWTGATTAPGVTDMLVGQQVGTTGVPLPASTETVTLTTSAYGWLGPFDQNTYNIANINANFGAIAGTPGALPASAQGCVAVAFTSTAQLQVRAYQIIQA